MSMAVDAIAMQPSRPMNSLLSTVFSCLLFCPLIMSTGLNLAIAADEARPAGIDINNAVESRMMYSSKVRIGCSSVSSRLQNMSLHAIAIRMANAIETIIMNSASRVHLMTTPRLSVPRS